MAARYGYTVWRNGGYKQPCRTIADVAAALAKHRRAGDTNVQARARVTISRERKLTGAETRDAVAIATRLLRSNPNRPAEVPSGHK